MDAPDGYRLTVDYAVRITGRGLYVHSAPWATQAMGMENISHGCISLSPADAEWYFNTVNVGDPVIVKEGVPSQVKSADPIPARTIKSADPIPTHAVEGPPGQPEEPAPPSN